jgi:hypothetical protein
MEENILASIKQMIGCETEYDHFDHEIIMCINSAFSILKQIGGGPQDHAFRIIDGSEVWDDFISEDPDDLVKNYVAIKVKKMFDPPSNSFLMTALNEQEKEYEWRLNVSAETP